MFLGTDGSFIFSRDTGNEKSGELFLATPDSVKTAIKVAKQAECMGWKPNSRVPSVCCSLSPHRTSPDRK
jgi:hypothetical protein